MPWAGANVKTHDGRHKLALNWDDRTMPNLYRMATMYHLARTLLPIGSAAALQVLALGAARTLVLRAQQ